jgi:hypothetical protein
VNHSRTPVNLEKDANLSSICPSDHSEGPTYIYVTRSNQSVIFENLSTTFSHLPSKTTLMDNHTH